MSFAWKTTLVTFILVSSFLFLPIHSSNGQTIIRSNPAPVRRDEGPFINQLGLVSFFRKLAAIESGNNARPAVILQYGDSHTKADLFTGEVRRNLQSQFSGRVPVQEAAYRSTAAHGVESIVFEPLGVNGARAKKLREMTGSEAFLRSVAQRNPDLIILAYGTNEVTDNDWTIASYEQLFVEIVNRFHAAAPSASILIMGPPDRAVGGGNGWVSARRMPSMIEAQRRAAYTTGAAFWSACEAMGGAGSMNAWYANGLSQPDRVHFTAKGYFRLGDLFFNDLMAAYRGVDLRRNPQTGVIQPPRRTISDADLNLMRGGTLLSNPRN